MASAKAELWLTRIPYHGGLHEAEAEVRVLERWKDMANLIRLSLSKRGFPLNVSLQRLLCEPPSPQLTADLVDQNEFEAMLRVLEG